MNDDDTRRLVALLVARSGLPASDAEVAALADGAEEVREAVARLYAVPLDLETEPGAVFRAR
jgi:hypothetical protein